ncbi:glutathione hydrolase 1 proenzyme-like [Melanaphis sacchari]|uniref:glutathione hydrolase 1 proenzyme-like n=1 Tax=Melanaphis sacchari TaxID=742174 RepID=UPI000DC149AB|nr:glutathione hydrolase 1 proenzyme-like [Melanaphis sacchari]
MIISRLQSIGCFVLLGLSILIAIVSVWVIISQHNVTNEIPDPEFELPPSSMPMGLYKKAGVVSNGGPCAQIGMDVMAKGGNAVDAAIATIICDGALCPHFMGLGGGFLMSIYNATTKKVMSINARETAPLAATDSMFVEHLNFL